MPMARYEARLEGGEGEVFSHLPIGFRRSDGHYAQDGVSCSLCHQISKDKLGTRESLVGGFVVDTTKPMGEREEYGPFKIDDGADADHADLRRAAFVPTEGEHIRQSELCATCHTLITKALGPDGQVIGELPEQMPYQEWLHSEFKRQAELPVLPHAGGEGAGPRSPAVLGEPREGMSRHIFVGGNFFMQRMLNRYRGELGVVALPQELEAAAERTVAHLQTRDGAGRDRPASKSRDGRLEADVVGRESGRAQVADGLSFAARVAARDGAGSQRPRGVRVGRLDAERPDSGQRQRCRRDRFEPHYTRDQRGRIRCRSTNRSWWTPTACRPRAC